MGNPIGELRTPQEHIQYVYDATWKDQLISYGEVPWVNGEPQTTVTVQAYTYDAQGNPTYITNFMFEGAIYDHATLEWSGRELSRITVYQLGSYVPVAIMTYKYNDQGYRTSKKIDKIALGSETIEYTLDGDKVIYETNGTYAIIYTYDYDGKIIGFSYDPNVNINNNEEDYFYLRNQLGDISHILDASGNTVVHYVYDAYGNIVKTDVTSGYGYIVEINSYTYRGYRYDSEINMYYLNSRYYNPEVGRFINSDGLLGQQGDILSSNMYAYGVNNPIMNIDPSGFAPAKTYIGDSALKQIFFMMFGTGGSVILIKTLLWGLGLMGTGVLATIGATILAIGTVMLACSVIWNIANIAAAIYYTIKDGGFKLKKHSWIVTWYSVEDLY